MWAHMGKEGRWGSDAEEVSEGWVSDEEVEEGVMRWRVVLVLGSLIYVIGVMVLVEWLVRMIFGL
jgi:flagellar biogenesis protein FliO